jgi:hypothetical protein
MVSEWKMWTQCTVNDIYVGRLDNSSVAGDLKRWNAVRFKVGLRITSEERALANSGESTQKEHGDVGVQPEMVERGGDMVSERTAAAGGGKKHVREEGSKRTAAGGSAGKKHVRDEKEEVSEGGTENEVAWKSKRHVEGEKRAKKRARRDESSRKARGSPIRSRLANHLASKRSGKVRHM